MLLDEPTSNLDINTNRWLEEVLNERDSTMIFISHDRHFLNSVCTHITDLDYGELRAYPGNYEGYLHSQGVEVPASNPAGKKANSDRK